MKTYYCIILFCILFFNLSYLYSQKEFNKETVLTEAQKLYKDGLVDNIPTMLRPYIEKGFSRKEKKEAYRLIILSYLFDDHKQEATEVLFEFMSIFPEFKLKEGDPNDLKYLYNDQNFKKNISFTIGPLAGYLSTSPVIEKSYNISGFESEKEIKSISSLVYGVQLTKRIYDYIDIRIDAIYGKNKYGFNQETPSSDITEYNETMTNLTLPFWFIPYFPINDHRVFIKMGGGAKFILESSSDVKLLMNSNSYDVKDKRNTLTKFIGAGAGFSFKIPRGFISLEGTYLKGLENIVNDSERNAIPDLENTYSYIDDDFKLNNLMFTLSYVFLFYNLKK